jgi:cupin superfamily acireductone dioxygenase involved in methionine salvage
MEEIDTSNGGESLTIDQAAAAYVTATTPQEADTSQSDVEDVDESEQTDDELQASDEDQSEETDGETDDEGQAEEDDEDEPGSDQGRYVAKNGKVRLEDGTTVTVDELIKGNLRDRDYRQKTMEAAETRKASEVQIAAAKALEEQLIQQREYVASLVKSIIPPQPDPSKADPRSPNYDPAGYQAEQVAYQQWANHLQYLETEQQRAEQERQAKTATETQERINKEWETALEKLPELKDQKRLQAFGQKTLKYGPEYGYTPQELANIHHDHRQLLVLKDAIAWRELQANKANVQKKVEGRPPIAKGGKRLSPGAQQARRATDAISRAKQSGSLEDVTAAFIASLNKG